ncbi:unnamed protein product [Parnassius apollo]|uniref:(apollo) hypothetical protein n=1 Tax=Parnassius apollo TaxID=110799 RepID=A0A8S3WSU9_PARAO|nr:unnamed protein product [Parnassius apollo]
MSVKEGLKNKKYKLVPPDGGWGYMIWIAVILNLVATTSFTGCFGIIFHELFIQLKMGSTHINLLIGITSICFAVSGFMTGPLLKFISMRKAGFIAATFLNLGSFGIIFVNSQLALFLCYGFMQGVGIGILNNISFSSINDYFVKRRLLSFSLIQSVTVVVAFLSPQLVKITLEVYGHRGAYILLAAINMQTFVAVFLMQPVDLHLKKIEMITVEDNEMKLLIVDDQSYEIPTVKISDKKRNSSYSDQKQEKDLKLSVTEDRSKGIKELILEALDVSFIKSFLLSNAGLGVAICISDDLIFTLVLPQTLYSLNWTEGEVAWAVSSACLGDLVTRVMFIIFSNWLLRFESQQIYIAGLFVAVITRIGILGSENYTTIIIYLALYGTSRCIIVILIPLVIAEAVQPEQFTSANGIFMLLFGFANLLFGPAIGAIRDLTGSYATAIYVLTSFFAIVIIFWIIEICYKKNKHKRQPKKNEPKK